MRIVFAKAGYSLKALNRNLLLLIVIILFSNKSIAQQIFITKGNATYLGDTSYRITQDRITQSGLITNLYPVDLSKSFEIDFEMNFGNKDNSGADGMAFMLTNECSPPLSVGGYLGISGTLNSIVCEFDTYNNGILFNDIADDHIGIYKDGLLSPSGNIMDSSSTPVCALPGCNNIEDNNWHKIKIKWDYIDSLNQKISVFFDGSFRTSSKRNHIKDRFKSNKIVYWSIGGATGFLSNLQQFRHSKNNNIVKACEGSAFTLQAPALGTSYVWSNGNTSTSNIATYTAMVSQTINCIYRDQCGITDTVFFSVNVAKKPTITLNNPALCAGSVASLHCTVSPNGPYNYYWQVPSGVNNPGSVADFNTIKAGAYSVYVIDSVSSCKSDTAHTTVNLAAFANAGNALQIFSGQGITIQASASVGSYLWTPSTGLSSVTVLQPVASPTTSTTYTLKVTSPQGCTATSSVLVTVINECVKIMEAFTPNGDGKNDKWLVTSGSCTQKVRARVYNRWGGKVFESRDYKNDWDGTYNGQPLPDGTYYYVVDFSFLNNSAINKKGNVTILR